MAMMLIRPTPSDDDDGAKEAEHVKMLFELFFFSFTVLIYFPVFFLIYTKLS